MTRCRKIAGMIFLLILLQNHVVQAQTAENASLPEAQVTIEIELTEHRLTLYRNGEIEKSYAVATGKQETPSPVGEWKIISKQQDWGDGFGTRWLGLNVGWGIYGIHGTNHPESIGSSQSHGCIRMHNEDVEDLYERVSVGTRVTIRSEGKLLPQKFAAPPLQKGDVGQDVVYLQSRLKEIGLILDYADGRFGTMTEGAVRYFQAWNGLAITGIANREVYVQLGLL